MINIENIKLTVFDFDDTIAIHKSKDYLDYRNKTENNYIDFFATAYLKAENFYDEYEPCYVDNNVLKLINELRKRNIKMCCLSGMSHSFHIEAKKNFIKKHIGDDIRFFSTSSQELKVKAIKILAKIYDCSFNEILFIDDIPENIERMSKISVNAVLVDNIINGEIDDIV